MKVERKIYKGIEYVALAELPQVQQEQAMQTLSPDLFIKILVDGTVVSRCIQYKDYNAWYDGVFSKRDVVVKSKTEHVALPGLALNNA
jgi:hypothetical protein